MTIPATVLQVLNDWQINFQTTNELELDSLSQHSPETAYSANTAQSILLFDKIGIIQIMIPSNRMLDLQKLEKASGRKLEILPVAKQEKLKQSLGVKTLPALPQVTRLDSLVDQSLLNQEEIYIESGEDSEWIKLSGSEFKSLTTSSNIGDYSTELSNHNYNSAQDDDAINNCITEFTQLRIKQRLEETLDLPPLPEIARKIIELKMDPNADTTSLAALVSLDPAMSAQVVAWARSPYYGGKDNINSVEEAVLRVLGFNLVINLALGLALGRTLAIPKDGPDGYAPCWEQAVMTASLMAEMVRLVPPENRPSQGSAYLAGLLHNFGYLILGHVFPPQFQLINRHIEANPHIGRHHVEQSILGVTREQISSQLFAQWGLPEDVVAAVRQQQNSTINTEDTMANLLYVATRALRRHQYGDGTIEQPKAEILEALGTDFETVMETTENVMQRKPELQQIAKLLSE